MQVLHVLPCRSLSSTHLVSGMVFIAYWMQERDVYVCIGPDPSDSRREGAYAFDRCKDGCCAYPGTRFTSILGTTISQRSLRLANRGSPIPSERLNS
jgi:hypothetical protein